MDKDEFDQSNIIKKINYLAKQQDELSGKLASIRKTLESSSGTDSIEPTSIPGEELKPSEVNSETGELNTYQFAGYEWVVAEGFENYAVLQSTGVTEGAWPGYTMTKPTTGSGNWGSVNSSYKGNIDGTDISGYDNKTVDLFNAIKDAEFTSATYGKGLYLVSKGLVGSISSDNSEMKKYLDLTGSKKLYNTALAMAVGNGNSLGARFNNSWLGTYGTKEGAYNVYTSGDIDALANQGLSRVIAPAFNVDLTKIEIVGNEIRKK